MHRMNRVDFHEARQLFHSKFGQHPTEKNASPVRKQMISFPQSPSLNTKKIAKPQKTGPGTSDLKDGKYLSNTYALEHGMNWTGILIEPLATEVGAGKVDDWGMVGMKLRGRGSYR